MLPQFVQMIALMQEVAYPQVAVSVNNLLTVLTAASDDAHEIAPATEHATRVASANVIKVSTMKIAPR